MRKILLFCLFFVATAAFAQKTLSGHTKVVTSVAFSPDGAILASGSQDGTVKIWRVSDGTLIKTIPEENHNSIFQVAFSADGNSLALFMGGANPFKIIRIKDGGLLKTLNESEGDNASPIAFSANGKMVAYGTRERNYAYVVRVRNALGGELIHAFNEDYITKHYGSMPALDFSPNGEMLAFSRTGEDNSREPPGVVRIFRLADKAEIFTWGGFVTSVAFSPDSKMLAMAMPNKSPSVVVISVSDRKKIAEISGCAEALVVAFVPSKKILACSTKEKIELYNVVSWNKIATLSAHSELVTSIAFSPDGRVLASGSWDNAIKLWDLPSIEAGEKYWSQELNGTNPQLMYLKAGQYARTGNFNKSIQLYESIIKRFPDSPFAVKADDQLSSVKKRLERVGDEKKEAQTRAYDPCSHLYVGKVVSLKGAFGITFDGEVRGIGGGKASVRSFNPVTTKWENDEFSCGEL